MCVRHCTDALKQGRLKARSKAVAALKRNVLRTSRQMCWCFVSVFLLQSLQCEYRRSNMRPWPCAEVRGGFHVLIPCVSRTSGRGGHGHKMCRTYTSRALSRREALWVHCIFGCAKMVAHHHHCINACLIALLVFFGEIVQPCCACD